MSVVQLINKNLRQHKTLSVIDPPYKLSAVDYLQKTPKNKCLSKQNILNNVSSSLKVFKIHSMISPQ